MKLVKNIVLVTLAVGALASVEASAFSLTNAKNRVVKFVEKNKKPILIGTAVAVTALVIVGAVGGVMYYNSKKGAATQTGTKIVNGMMGANVANQAEAVSAAAALVAASAAPTAPTLPVTPAVVNVVQHHPDLRSTGEPILTVPTNAVEGAVTGMNWLSATILVN